MAFDTTEMLNFRTALLSKNGHDSGKSFNSLIDAFTKYRIPVVTLKDLTIEKSVLF